MGKNGEEEQQLPKSSTLSEPSRLAIGPPRPSITLPPRTSMESLFNGGSLAGAGFSPGPMTLLSSFFADNDDCKSFSQLLAGAMGSPAAVPANRGGLPPALEKNSGEVSSNSGFKQSRPLGLSIASSPVFTIPPGLSPAGLLDSPGFFLPGQGPFGMTHQQVLAQVTAHAAQANSHIHFQDQHSSVSSAPANSSTQLHDDSTSNTTPQQMPPLIADSGGAVKEPSNHDNSDHRQSSSSLMVDKPAADGYNWRKYGQKQVKGSEFPRSYYKCTHLNCPVKKKVERSLDGQVTEIIYKGQHNHEPPAPNKRGRDTGNVNEDSNVIGEIQSGSINRSREGMVPYSLALKEQESSQATAEHLSGTSDSEEVENAEPVVDEKDDEPHPKRRNTEVRPSDPASSHRTVTESRIIVQTTSEVDLLDDGYRWRKYGQKVVKGNPYPRSYYKCTSQGCNVRKHVERASTDPKAVITTYEGKHNHDVPATRYSSHNTGNNGASHLRLQNSGIEKQRFNSRDSGNNDPQPVGRLRLKKEQIM